MNLSASVADDLEMRGAAFAIAMIVILGFVTLFALKHRDWPPW